MLHQCTIANPLHISGIGLHTGSIINMVLRPAKAGTGIIFERTEGNTTRRIRACAQNVVDTRMATVIGDGKLRVSTIEHLMAALVACHIDNLIIKIDGPEVPIMDGSAAPFIDKILCVGVTRLEQNRKIISITKPIHLQEGDKKISIIPSRFLRISFDLDFNHPCIKRQSRSVKVSQQSFCQDIAGARTFGFYEEVEYLKSQGLAKGGSLDNAVVIGADSILNPEGLRFTDEFVRHKILDTVGDFSLLGHSILGHIKSHKGGHDINHKMVEKILASPDSWRYIEFNNAAYQEGMVLPTLQPEAAMAKA
ncbi:MAG: UDP-3-O-acyl-N-acetylglucosamine deacetylase [Desulfuromonadaceae bacterium]|nr:UDP-3-O-acyl-N-acetylglucosamine deacetylase [Desulfuromonadaceae bacterium]